MALHQTKKCLHSKENHEQNEMKRQPTEWEKIFANGISHKDSPWYPKLVKNSYNLTKNIFFYNKKLIEKIELVLQHFSSSY